jgi:hypothetical protein
MRPGPLLERSQVIAQFLDTGILFVTGSAQFRILALLRDLALYLGLELSDGGLSGDMDTRSVILRGSPRFA